LVLHKQVIDFGSGSSSKIKQTAYSDANGNFVLKHNGSLVNKFIVLIEFPDGSKGYHLVGWKDETGNPIGTYQLPVEKGNLMKVKLELLPYGYFKLEYNNTSCFDQTDTIFSDIRNNYYIVTNGYEFFRNGCGSLTTNNIKIPIGEYQYSGRVVKNNSQTWIYQNFTVYEDSSITTVIDY